MPSHRILRRALLCLGTTESTVAATEDVPREDTGVDEAASSAEGCKHYRRGCRVLAPCCNEWFDCRLCHDERHGEDHTIDRHAIREMECRACEAVQPCLVVVGEYFCPTCNLFDHEGETKKIFHCDECGICRVGGRENYFHCAKCCGCYPHSLNNKHQCLEGSMHRECAICFEVTFASTEGVNVLPCGHVLHRSCWKEYVRYGHAVCPTCRTSMFTCSDLEEAADGDEDESETDHDDDDDTDMTDEEDEDGDEDEDTENDNELDNGNDDDDDNDNDNNNHGVGHEENANNVDATGEENVREGALNEGEAGRHMT